MRPREISREELFALVWEKPTIDVAQELGVSDVAVAKLCARLQVPKPPRGYWARVRAGSKPRIPPLRAFREELEARRKRAAREVPSGTRLSDLQRKFLDRALHEIASAGVSLIDVRIASQRIVALPGDIAAAALILIQNRHAQWVETKDLDVPLIEGARRSLGNLAEKLLTYARPQVVVLEQATKGRSTFGNGPLVIVRLTADLQARLADLAHLVKTRGLDHVVLPLHASEQAWTATPVYLAAPYARAESRLCVSATELWATCTISTPRYLTNPDEVEDVTTERAPLREVMPIDLLPAREVAAARAVREVRLRDHWPRLRALIEAERVLDILDTSLSDIGSDAPDDRLALTDRILFGDERPLLTARRALRRLAEDVERWREELDAERADLCFEMIGLQRGDVVVHGEAGKIARIELTRADLFVRDNRVCISSQGPRFRKDGLPGKRDEMLVFNLQGPRSGG